MTETIAKLKDAPAQGARQSATYWRVEGSLLEVGAMRLVGFFTWNAQSFSERWRGGWAWRQWPSRGPLPMLLAAPSLPASPHAATRRQSDRLDLLGEEYFHYVLKPQLRREAAEKLLAAVRGGEEVVLVSQLLDHVLRPLANHFGISSFVSNRLEFRDGSATGRLVSPVRAAARTFGVDCQRLDGRPRAP